MSDRITANSVRQSMVVTSLTTEEVEAYEKAIMGAANVGSTNVVLQCVRKVTHWSHSNPHMKQVESHFTRQGFVCKLELGCAARDQRDEDHLAALTVNWAEPSIGYRGVDEK